MNVLIIERMSKMKKEKKEHSIYSTVQGSSYDENGGKTPGADSIKELSVWTHNLSAAYNGEPPVLKDIDLALPRGELTVIVGPNGAGKSTLFNLLMGMMSPLTGEIKIFGESVDSQRCKNKIAFVPQHEDIDWDYPIRVWDVVLGGRYGYMRLSSGFRRFLPPNWAGSEHADAAKEALRAVDMFSFRKRPIGALSGGQKKRVFVARALAQDARLLLMDEPLVGVDKSSEELIMDVLLNNRKKDRTIIMVTHDLNGAREYADRMILLNSTIVDAGAPGEVLNRIQDYSWNLKSISGIPEKKAAVL